MSGWTKLRFKILAVFSLVFFFIIGLLKQIISYLFTAIILILLYTQISYASSTWTEVLTAYYSAKVNYPKQKIWIEQIEQGYRIWRRPPNTSYVYYSVNGINGTSQSIGGYAGNAPNCTGNPTDLGSYAANTGGYTFSSSSQSQRIYKYCDGSTTTSSGVDSFGLQWFPKSPCWYDTVYSSVNCKTSDVLIQEFFDIMPNCSTPGGITMQVGSYIYGGDSSKGCDCTPEGTVFHSVSSGSCEYVIITGDPSVSPPKIPSDTPGYTHITNTVTSPPVTNPNGSVTQVVTNTFPDNSQDVKTSVTINNVTTTTTERFVGGVSIGTIGTSTTTKNTDGSSVTNGTMNGVTTNVLTGGGVTQTQTTYSSGLSVTSATGGSSSGTGSVATSGGGTGTGGGGGGGSGTGGGTVKIDTETSTAVAPVASEKPAYSDSRLAGADGKTFGDFGNLLTDFSNGVKATSLFSRFNFNEFSNSISGAASSPIQEINFGRFGKHNVDLSTYSSSFLIIKGIMLVLASYLATRIVVLKR